MPVEISGLLEDVEKFEGKNGFGANVTLSAKVEKRTKRLTFMIKSEEMANELENLLDTDVVLKIELNQNNFGLRLGEILEIGA